jgi:TPR repeat protein
MRFVSAVALALVMLWVPVDGVTQTQAEREMLQLYESRERQLLASMDPEADRAENDALLSSCVARAIAGSGGRRGGIGAGMAECTDRMTELGNRQAARRNALQQELFALRQDKLELQQRIRLTRASPPPPPQPEVRGPPVTASAGATVVCSMSAEELRSLRSYAEQGDAVAQAELGSVYGNGNCVPQDYIRGMREPSPASGMRTRMASAYRRTMSRRCAGIG